MVILNLSQSQPNLNARHTFASMTSTAKLNDKEYTKLLDNEDISAASYKEIATAFMENGVKETYHALVNKQDRKRNDNQSY